MIFLGWSREENNHNKEVMDMYSIIHSIYNHHKRLSLSFTNELLVKDKKMNKEAVTEKWLHSPSQLLNKWCQITLVCL